MFQATVHMDVGLRTMGLPLSNVPFAFYAYALVVMA